MTGWLTAAAMAPETWVGVLVGFALGIYAMRGPVARWERSANYWFVRCVRAEGRVEELFMDHQEQRTRKEYGWEIISERAKLIDAAKAKCGPDFPHIVGTELDPVFLSRANADHDDVCWVATVDELTGPRTYEGSE